MSTYGTLYTQIKSTIGNRDDTDTDAIILAYFNHAQRALARVHRWRELEAKITPNLVAGTQDYSFTTLGFTRYQKLYSAVLMETTRGRPLGYITPDQWDRDVTPYILTASQGKPDIYTIWSSSFSFFRIPDDDYQVILRYYQYPTPAVDISTTLTFEDADDLLIFLTIAFVWMALEELEQASVWGKRAGELFKSYDIEFTNVLNFKSIPATKMGIPDYWLDPFVKSMP